MKRKKKPAARAAARPALLPLGALAAGFGLAFGSAHAQTTAPEDSKETTLAPIKVKGGRSILIGHWLIWSTPFSIQRPPVWSPRMATRSFRLGPCAC